MNWFKRYFEVETESDADALKDGMRAATNVISFSEHPYFEVVIDYLTTEAERPLTVGDHMEMVKAAVRSNTFKEVREHLRRVVKNARNVAASVPEE